jgi:hypothetical protein
MSHFDFGANSSPGLGLGDHSVDSHLESGNDQEPPVVVNSEGRVDITVAPDDSIDNFNTFPASDELDQLSLGLGDYSKVPASRIDSTHAGEGGSGGLRSLLEPYADGNANNVSALGGTPPSLPIHASLSTVCFTYHFLIF